MLKLSILLNNDHFRRKNETLMLNSSFFSILNTVQLFR